MNKAPDEDVFFVNVLRADDRRTGVDMLRSLEHAIDTASQVGFRHTLITVGDERLDPIGLAQWGMSRNPAFSPLIAVNPVYQHPVECAKRIISLQSLYANRIALNLITGSFANEMIAIGDHLDFEARLERLKEFVTVLHGLLSTKGMVDLHGKYYQVSGAHVLSASPRRPVDYFLSGSESSRLDVIIPNAHFVSNLRPRAELAPARGKRSGLLVGIVARPGQAEAEEAARALFPPDRKGEMIFSLASSKNDSPWNIWLREHLKKNRSDDPDYYLDPMLRYQALVPYLVGSYDRVAENLTHCVGKGYHFFLTDVLDGEETHVSECIRRVVD